MDTRSVCPVCGFVGPEQTTDGEHHCDEAAMQRVVDWEWVLSRRQRCTCSASEYERHAHDCGFRMTREEWNRSEGR
jgi:hypothetical protein